MWARKNNHKGAKTLRHKLRPILSCNSVPLCLCAFVVKVCDWNSLTNPTTLSFHTLRKGQVMRFEYYSEAIADAPKLSVDGTVSNSIHFSHWQGNETPAELKADTSTEIALNLVTSPNRN